MGETASQHLPDPAAKDARRWAKRALGLFVPYTLAVVLRERRYRRRRERIRESARAAGVAETGRFDFARAVDTLVERGLDRETVLHGTITPHSLRFVADTIAAHFPAGRPIRVLQVGNFVGISLSAVSDAAVALSPDSVVVSIDPNIAHLGIENPERHALELLRHFGLQRNNLVIPGYSLENAVPGHEQDSACEYTLHSLARLGVRFDVALVDGSHAGPYVRRELEALLPMLEPGALLFLDDAHESWIEIQELYEAAAADERWPLEEIDHDGRVGVLRRT
jgi:predicted O-methyltransferase YrrM